MFEHACGKCEKTFSKRSNLNQHNNQLHVELKCDECGKMFKKGNFARHRKVHADSDSVSRCQICAKTFSRTDNMMHMLTNAMKKIWSCTNVGKILIHAQDP